MVLYPQNPITEVASLKIYLSRLKHFQNYLEKQYLAKTNPLPIDIFVIRGILKKYRE